MAGRPTKYKAEYAKQAEKLCELGATDVDLADFFDVDVVTVWRWKTKHAPFCKALKLGKDKPNDLVERSLYQRAVGYTAPETDIRVIDGVIVETPMLKHYPPDSTALIFFLKNRMPEQYRANPTESGSEDDTLAKALLLLADKLPG